LGRKKLQNYAVELLQKMVQISSPPGKEKKIGDFLEIEMRGLGYMVYRDSIGNVIGRLGENAPTVLLCGHMDTIPGQIPINLCNGILYGRGSVDAKGPLAAMIIAASELFHEGFKGSLIVAAVVDEEGRNQGVKTLIEDDLKVDYAIFGEPSNVDEMTVAYKGMVLIEVTCETETGHSSAPWLYKNAIEQSLTLYNSLKGIADSITGHDQGFKSVSICLRKIEGGKNTGKVPDKCKMIIEFRIPPGVTVASLMDIINDGVIKHGVNNPEINTSFNALDSVEPYQSNLRSNLVRAFTRAIYQLRKKPVKLVKKAGTGDMNYYGPAVDIPVLTYGPGDPHLDHTSEEHLIIEDYLTSITVLKETLRNLYSIHSHSGIKSKQVG
jgi:LysW-gamma-L-lysine carboxypeptidase